MKRKIFTLFQIVATVAMLFSTNSCSNLMNNPLQDKETGDDITLLLLDLNFFETKLIIRFEDFDTGELLTGQDITASLLGEQADQFVTVFGEKKDEFKTSAGILELYLDPSYTFTADPISLDIFAYSGTDWLSEPASVEISEAGERTVIVRMIDWSKSANLKSAMAGVTIDVSEDPAGQVKKINLNGAAYGNGYTNLIQYYNRAIGDPYAAVRAYYTAIIKKTQERYLQSGNQFYLTRAQLYQDRLDALPDPPSTPSVNLKANSISLDENVVEYWGFFYPKGKEVTLAVSQQANTTYKRNSLSKCANGLVIKVNAPELSADDLTSSGSFKYTITYSDGTNTKGAISGSFKSLKSNGNKIEPIYYPTNNPQVTVTLQENSQFTFEQATQTLSSPCGEVTFVAKKKENLVNYNFTVTYTCSVAGLTYSGTGLFKNITKMTPSETFNLSVGGFSLNLIKGDKYLLSVIIDNDAYSLNIDTNDIEGSLLGQSVDGNTVTNVTVTGSDSEGYNVDMKVALTDKICGKING